MTIAVEATRPFHESIIDVLPIANGSQLTILADLIKRTAIPKKPRRDHCGVDTSHARHAQPGLWRFRIPSAPKRTGCVYRTDHDRMLRRHHEWISLFATV